MKYYLSFLRQWPELPSYLWFLLSGLLLGVGFVWAGLWFVGLGGVAIFVQAARNSVSYKQVLVGGFLSWFLKSVLVLSWFWSTYPLNWVDTVRPVFQYILIIWSWLGSSFGLGIGGLVCAATLYYLGQNKKQLMILVLIPLVWVMSEYFGAAAFSLINLGPGISPNADFSFGSVGYLLASFHPALAFVTYGGVYTMGILLVALSLALSSWLSISYMYSCRRLLTTLTIVLFLVCYTATSLNAAPGVEKGTVAVIDTRFDTVLLNTDDGQAIKIKETVKAIQEALKYDVDYIILPEDARYLSNIVGISSNLKTTFSQVNFIHGNKDTVVLDSGRHILPDGKIVLRSFVIDGRSDVIYETDKQYLVPQGEFIPYVSRFIFSLVGFKEAVKKAVSEYSYQPGPAKQTDDIPPYIPGLLFCSESFGPGRVRDLTTTRAVPFVAHSISHGWFHQPVILWRQLDLMLQLHAKVSGVPIISAGNMVVGQSYWPDGSITRGDVLYTDTYFTISLVEL